MSDEEEEESSRSAAAPSNTEFDFIERIRHIAFNQIKNSSLIAHPSSVELD